MAPRIRGEVKFPWPWSGASYLIV